jgi:phosphoserine phosphatase
MIQVRALEAALAAQQAAWRREALCHVWLRERAQVLQLVRVLKTLGFRIAILSRR